MESLAQSDADGPSFRGAVCCGEPAPARAPGRVGRGLELEEMRDNLQDTAHILPVGEDLTRGGVQFPGNGDAAGDGGGARVAAGAGSGGCGGHACSTRPPG